MHSFSKTTHEVAWTTRQRFRALGDLSGPQPRVIPGVYPCSTHGNRGGECPVCKGRKRCREAEGGCDDGRIRASRVVGDPHGKEQIEKCLAAGEQALAVVWRDTPVRNAALALRERAYTDDVLQEKSQQRREREEKEASALVPVHQTLVKLASSLGTAFPARLNRRVKPFAPEELQIRSSSAGGFKTTLVPCASCSIGFRLWWLTSSTRFSKIENASLLLLSHSAHRTRRFPAMRRQNNSPTRWLSWSSCRHHLKCVPTAAPCTRNCRRGRKMDAALTEQERELEPEVRFKVNGSWRTEWKPTTRQGRESSWVDVLLKHI